MMRRAVSLRKTYRGKWEERCDDPEVMLKHSLLLDLLIRVALFLGEVSFDLKIDSARLKWKHQHLNDAHQ